VRSNDHQIVDRERLSIDTELDPPFDVLRPIEQTAAFVFCSPHSGRVYPSALTQASRLSADALRRSEDCYVDDLFTSAIALGAPLIAARFPRAYLDVNREPFELDAELFAEPLPPYANSQSLRVAGGLGTIPRIVSETEQIYPGRLPLAVGLERIERLYKPFHASLQLLIAETERAFGHAILLDCHSMPSASMQHPGSPRPDFVIGDRFGSSCSPRLTRIVRDQLATDGYRVQLNRPYAGGYITEHYGRPKHGTQALQIEINRALYLDETTFATHAGFKALREALARLMRRLFHEFPASRVHSIAAE
jgi:N-formylglutamate amidohydrolase